MTPHPKRSPATAGVGRKMSPATRGVGTSDSPAAVHRERTDGRAGDDALVLLRQPQQVLAESIPLLDGEHGPRF